MKNNILQNSTIHYVEIIIETGIKNRASDIHVKYDEFQIEIKYRVDGKMLELEELYEKISKNILEKNIVEIISRLKILSNMNVAEKRKPQDGSFSFLFNKENRAMITATINDFSNPNELMSCNYFSIKSCVISLLLLIFLVRFVQVSLKLIITLLECYKFL